MGTTLSYFSKAPKGVLLRTAFEVELKPRFISVVVNSDRQQFSANAKKGEVSLDEIAALMGHASTETAMMHYGRRVSGKPNGIAVSANEEDIKQVRELNQHKNLIFSSS